MRVGCDVPANRRVDPGSPERQSLPKEVVNRVTLRANWIKGNQAVWMIPGFFGPRNDRRIHRAFFVGAAGADPPTSEHYGVACTAQVTP